MVLDSISMFFSNDCLFEIQSTNTNDFFKNLLSIKLWILLCVNLTLNRFVAKVTQHFLRSTSSIVYNFLCNTLIDVMFSQLCAEFKLKCFLKRILTIATIVLKLLKCLTIIFAPCWELVLLLLE